MRSRRVTRGCRGGGGRHDRRPPAAPALDDFRCCLAIRSSERIARTVTTQSSSEASLDVPILASIVYCPVNFVTHRKLTSPHWQVIQPRSQQTCRFGRMSSPLKFHEYMISRIWLVTPLRRCYDKRTAIVTVPSRSTHGEPIRNAACARPQSRPSPMTIDQFYSNSSFETYQEPAG